MPEPLYLSCFSRICRLLDLEGYLCSDVMGHPSDEIIYSFSKDIDVFNDLYQKHFFAPSKLSLTWITINISLGENYYTGEEECEFKTIVYDREKFDEHKIRIKLGFDNLDDNIDLE